MLSVRQPLRTSLSLGVAQRSAGCLKSAFSCMTLYYTTIQVSTVKCHSLTSPLKEEDCARAQFTRCASAVVSRTAKPSFSEELACRGCRRKAADREVQAGDRPRQKWQTPVVFAVTAHNPEMRAGRPGFPGLPPTCRCSCAYSAGRRARAVVRKIRP